MGRGKGQGEGEGPPCCIRYALLMRQLRAPASRKGIKTKKRRGGGGRFKSKTGTYKDQVEGTEVDEEAEEEIVTLRMTKRAGLFGDPKGDGRWWLQHSAPALLLPKVAEARDLIMLAHTALLNTGAIEYDFTVWWISLKTESAKTAVESISAVLQSISAAPLESICAESGLAVCAMDEAQRMSDSVEDLQDVSQLKVVFANAMFAVAELSVLCCCRGLDVDMQPNGIPKSLRMRLAAACGRDENFVDDYTLLSKLGKAKYEVFTPGRRRGNGPRNVFKKKALVAESA